MAEKITPTVTISLDEYNEIKDSLITLKKVLNEKVSTMKVVRHPYWGENYIVMDDSDVVQEFFGDLEALMKFFREEKDHKSESKVYTVKKKWFEIWKKL